MFEEYKRSNDFDDDADTLLKNVQDYELQDAQVVICTCMTSGDSRLADMPFDAVVLDESTQCLETE